MSKNGFFVLLISVIVVFQSTVFAQDKSAPAKSESRIQRIAGLSARFIVALIDDGAGGAWIGTED